MITKTEVLKAIADCEPAGGWGPLDNTPATVSRGALHVLVEAAKCARYEVIDGYQKPSSNSAAILDSREYAAKDHCDDAS